MIFFHEKVNMLEYVMRIKQIIKVDTTSKFNQLQFDSQFVRLYSIYFALFWITRINIKLELEKKNKINI